MIRFAFCMSLMLLSASASADSASQVSWAGGPGLPGPVMAWGNRFFSESGTLWGEGALESGYTAVYIGPADWAWSLGANDIDGDGHPDVVAASRMADQVVWWENADGCGETWIEQTVGYAADVVSVDPEDIDGDGHPDIVSACGESNDLSWWKSHVTRIGVTWTKNPIGSYYGAADVVARDMDGDGDRDVASTNWNYHSVSWWENLNGSGASWVQHSVDMGIIGPRDLRVGDINGDGDMDIAVISSENDLVVWWENTDGVGTLWSEQILKNQFDGWGISIADMDDDGDQDIVACEYSPGLIIWFENGGSDQGRITWTEHTVDSDTEALTAIVTDDVDGDGDQDVISGGWGNLTAWWENLDGKGMQWSEHPILCGGGWSLCTTNVDGDHFIDLIGGFPSNVRRWDLDYPVSSSLESSILYLGNDLGMGWLDWVAEVPSNTSRVCFQVRASDDPSQMGLWSDTLIAPGSLDGILDASDSYFQYRAILQTQDPFSTPTLLSVTLTWNSTGTEAQQEAIPEATSLLPVTPCPVRGSATIGFQLAEEGTVEFSIFDVTGRIIYRASESRPAGPGEMVISGLDPGVCFVRIRAGEFLATQRFVVVE
jgi:hypothetical protein